MRYHSPTVRMAQIQNVGEGVEQQELSVIAAGITTLEDRVAVSYKTKHTLNIWPSSCAPSIYTNSFKTYVYTKTCTHMFIAALFIIAKTWKQPIANHSVGEWTDKLWQTQQMWFAAKRNEPSSHEKTWGNLHVYY